MLEINSVHNGDWLKLFTKVEINSVDLVVTSPPYYNARDYGNPMFIDPYAWEDFCLDVLASCCSCLKDTGVIWWNTGSGYKDNHKLTNIFSMITKAETGLGLFLIDEIPWIKKSFLPKAYVNRPYAAWEHNFIFARRPLEVTYYVDNVREPYAESTLQRLKYPVGNLQANSKGEFNSRKMIAPNPLGKSPPNYLFLNCDLSRRDHPAPMAPELANWAIRAYSKEGNLVLDPMCGIGTTLIEAKKLGRNYLGVEINPKYCEEAVKCLTN
jgi:DNA modification methylase